MKKIYSTLVLFLLLAGSFAQVPMHYNTNANGGGNVFPFANAATSRKVTWFIPPNSLNSPNPLGAGNMITHVYFQMGTAASRTFPLFNIKFKTGTGTGLPGAGPCETGLTVVYNATNLTINTTALGWYQFQLQTPWAYNPNVPLIVEVEHNSTSTGGPQVLQAVNIPGPGNGRHWSDYLAVNTTGVGLQQVNFGVDVIPATPCSVTPGPNTVVTPTAAICPNSSAQLSLANSYTVGGITYQWQYSNVSAVGPWTNVPNGNSAFLTTPSLSTVHYFNTIITCTNTNGSVTATSGTLDVSATTTNNVYYSEGFEGIGEPNKLPNCSWNMSHPGTTCLTYTSVQNMNRSPRTGQRFASFYYTPAQSNYFWTNGIWMEAGVTYSTSMWYKTEYNTNPTWQLNMWVSPAQNTTTPGASTIATTGGAGSAASPAYTSLSNTFTIPSSGFYHVGINGISNGSSASYLSWDDLEVMVPCDLNPVPLMLSTITQTVCSGTSVNLMASGADTYIWNNGATTPVITVVPYFNTVYSVLGTNVITGCSQAQSINIDVLPSPLVSAFATQTAVCLGKSTSLLGFGADSYAWSNSTSGANITVSPTSNTTYTVTGTNNNGCASTGTVAITVNQLPPVTAGSDNSGTVCQEDASLLSANGAVSYIWVSSSSTQMGNPITVSPNFSTTYTVTGTDGNGCSNIATVPLTVTQCVGLAEAGSVIKDLKVYPNPTSGLFTIELTSTELKNIEVMDLTGRKVLEQSTSNEKVEMDINKLANGVYYLKISVKDQTSVLKLIKD